jgi:hypothetical protein
MISGKRRNVAGGRAIFLRRSSTGKRAVVLHAATAQTDSRLLREMKLGYAVLCKAEVEIRISAK